jgi:hypothetical protein
MATVRTFAIRESIVLASLTLLAIEAGPHIRFG